MTKSPPRGLTAGTSLSYRRADPRFPANAGWVYSLAMRIPGYAPVPATADGAEFVFNIAASVTADWQPGTYAYSERVTNGDEVHEIGTGTLTIRPNLAIAKAGDDGRTHNERTLSMLEAAIEGRALDGIESYSIAGRAVSKLAFPELVRLRDKYRVYVAMERNKGRLGTVQIAFGGTK